MRHEFEEDHNNFLHPTEMTPNLSLPLSRAQAKMREKAVRAGDDDDDGEDIITLYPCLWRS